MLTVRTTNLQQLFVGQEVAILRGHPSREEPQEASDAEDEGGGEAGACPGRKRYLFFLYVVIIKYFKIVTQYKVHPVPLIWVSAIWFSRLHGQ